MSTTRSSIPHLHTHWLSREQRSLCLLNPSYASRLVSLEHLYKQVLDLGEAIGQQEAQQGSLPNCAALSEHERARYPAESARQERRLLERNMLEWDDELAGLAEFLLAKPKFEIRDELEFIEGAWYWKLPPGKMYLPRHNVSSAVSRSSNEQLPPYLRSRKRWSRIFHRSPDTSNRLQRTGLERPKLSKPERRLPPLLPG